MSKVAVLLQARMSSRRLPGKVVRPLAGAPSILRMMERVEKITKADERWVVTSTDPSDDPLAELLETAGVAIFRGDLDDVLGRFQAACPKGCDTVVRLTGDCPLIDPGLVDAIIERHQGSDGVDYTSNAVLRTQPDGLDAEVFSRAILERAAREAKDPRDREHVTPWIIRHGKRANFTQHIDLSALRWTLDNERDYENIAAIFEALYPTKPDFDRFDVYRLLLSRPSLLHIANVSEPSPKEIADWCDLISLHIEEEK